MQLRLPEIKLPRLTPLQSRFAASLLASIAILVIYFALTSPRFAAYAAELDSIPREDHNHHWLGGHGSGIMADHMVDDEQQDVEEEQLELRQEPEYRAEFNVGVPRQAVPGPDQPELKNNEPGNKNLSPGNTDLWFFKNDSLWATPATQNSTVLTNVFDSRSVQVHMADHELQDGLEADDVDLECDVEDSSCEDLRHSNSTGLQRRQASITTRKVYISINICIPPQVNSTSAPAPPQPTMYISTNPNVIKPNASSTTTQGVTALPLTEGYAATSVDATSGVWISIVGPSTLPSGYVSDANWNYDLAVSIDGQYHKYIPVSDNPWLYLVDSDINAALFVTDNLTDISNNATTYETWMTMDPPPFVMYAFNTNDTRLQGITQSACALKKTFEDREAGVNVTHNNMTMVTRGIGHLPKQQFFIQGLNRSTEYSGYLAMEGNGTAGGKDVVGGGGKIWQPIKFKTKSDGNCALLFDLDFCDEVAYAVPYNPDLNFTQLAATYDNNSYALYQNFTYTLDQVACDAPGDSLYSLSTNCSACKTEYKNWLCSVTIPRCEDFSNNNPWLQPRAVGTPILPNIGDQQQILNSPDNNATNALALYSSTSRNPIIDDTIKPGPYKEILPCENLCYNMVRTCPAALQFACPTSDWGLWRSYGSLEGISQENITCNYYGYVYYKNASVRSMGVNVTRVWWVAVGVVIGFMLP